MPDAQPPVTTPPTPPTQADAPGQGQQQPAQGQRTHHSATQPRDGAQRFAGPPGTQPEAQERPEEQLAAPRRLKVVYREHGKDIEEELTEDELVESRRQLRALRHREQISTERFQRAGQLAQEAKDAQVLAKALAEGDYSKIAAYYAKNGKQPVEVLGNLLERALAERDMDPKERALAEREARIAQHEAEIARQEEERESATFNQKVSEQRQQLHNAWGHLLEQQDLPKTEQMLDIAAQLFMESVEATGGKGALAPEQLASLTRWHLVDATAKPVVNGMEAPQFLKHFSGPGSIVEKIDKGLEPEAFLERFPDLGNRLLRHFLKQARGQNPRTSQPAPRRSTQEQPGKGAKREIMLPTEMMNGIGGG